MARFRLPFQLKSRRNSPKTERRNPFQVFQREFLPPWNNAAEDDVEFIPTRPLYTKPPQPQPPKPPRPWRAWCKWSALGLSLPLGIIAVANLPYGAIRRPVAHTAPALLLPSYLTIDRHFNTAIAATETAQNRLEATTTPETLEQVRQDFVAAREHFNALPLDFLQQFPQCDFGIYRCQYNSAQYQQAITQLDQIEATLTQENQAQLSLTQAEQNVKSVKWDYLQAYTDTDRNAAIAQWQLALDQLAQIPPQTLAGDLARAKLIAYEQEFQQTVSPQDTPETQIQRAAALIESARQFAWQAALASQNPPHTVAHWQHVEHLWERAIRTLERISSTNLDQYKKAQRLLAQYNAYLGQIQVRRQAEQNASTTLTTAQSQLEHFLTTNPKHPQARAQLQSILYKLDNIPTGTTAHAKAQKIRQWVQGQLEGI
jgi:hypothetical protein